MRIQGAESRTHQAHMHFSPVHFGICSGLPSNKDSPEISARSLRILEFRFTSSENTHISNVVTLSLTHRCCTLNTARSSHPTCSISSLSAIASAQPLRRASSIGSPGTPEWKAPASRRGDERSNGSRVVRRSEGELT